MRKALLVISILLLCFGLLFAAPQQEAEGLDTIVVMACTDQFDTPFGERPIIKYVEEKLNIKIEWRLFPHADRDTAINLMIAAGGDMPDLFPAYLSGDLSAVKLEEKNIIYAWSDFMEAGKMPLTVAKLNEPKWIGVKNQLTDIETGKIYGIPPLSFTDMLIWTDYVRGDWLEAFGMEIPETMAEYRDYLRAVKTQDPNGNGKADEIGWMNFYEGVNWLNMWGRNFGLTFPDYSQSTFSTWRWSVIDSEEIVFAPTHERFKAMLEYLNSLWEEGLINQEQFNMTSPKFNTSIADNTCGSQNMWPSAIPGMTKRLRELAPEGLWLPIPHPYDPRFVKPEDRKYAKRGPVSFTWLITQSGKSTEAAVKLVDFLFGDEDFVFTAEYGVRGVEHEIDENGNPYFIGKWAEMDERTRFISSGGTMGGLPIEIRSFEMLRRIKTDPIFDEYKTYLVEIDPYMKPACLWKLTSEESALGKAAIKDILTYIEECVMKFIIGTKPFDEWDEYVKTINEEAGDKIEKARQVYQDYFDKYVEMYY